MNSLALRKQTFIKPPARMEGGRGVSRPPGAKAESLVPGWTFPNPSPAPIFALETSRTRCPRGLLSSARIAAEGTKQAGCRSSAAAEGALAQRTKGRAHLWPPGPAPASFSSAPPAPISLKEEVSAGSPRLKGARRGEHTCGGGGVPGWGAGGRRGPGLGAEGPPRWSRVRSQPTCSRRPLWVAGGMGG